MKNELTLWENRLAELNAQIREMQAAGATKRQLAHLRTYRENLHGAIRAIKTGCPA